MVIMMNEEVVEELLSFKDFIEKYQYNRSDEIIAYELYLIIKKLDKVIDK